MTGKSCSLQKKVGREKSFNLLGFGFFAEVQKKKLKENTTSENCLVSIQYSSAGESTQGVLTGN